jgi:uncharacterized protein (DUF1778 family)
MGRGTGQHKAVLNVRLPVEERDALLALAAARGQSPSEFVRQALNAVLGALRTRQPNQKETS